MSTTVTSKGQATIPRTVRERLGIRAGDKVDFLLSDEGQIVLRKVGGDCPKSRFADIVGIAGPGPTTDELMLMLRGPDDGL